MDWPIWMWPALGLYLAGSWVKNRVIKGDVHWNNSPYQDQLLREKEAKGIRCNCRSCIARRIINHNDR